MFFRFIHCSFKGEKKWISSQPQRPEDSTMSIEMSEQLFPSSLLDLKHLLQYSFKQQGSWCSRCFTLQLNDYFVPSPSIPMLLFIILLPNLQEQIAWEHNILPFTSAPSLIRCATFKVNIPETEVGGSWRLCFWGWTLQIILEWGRLTKQ